MNAHKLDLRLISKQNYFELSGDCMYNKSFIKNILTESFESQTGSPLPNDLFLEIWHRIDFTFSSIETDVLYHIDDVYYDLVQKASFKYKKNGKTTKRSRKMYRFYLEDC